MSLADFVLSAAGKLKDDYIRLNSHFASIKSNLLAGDRALQAQIDALTPGAVPAYYKTNVLNYAAPGATIYDGVTSAVSAINAALPHVPTGGTLYFPMLGNGEYLIDSDLTLAVYPDITIEFESGAKLSIADTKTFTGVNTKIEAGLSQVINLNTSGVLAGAWNLKEVYPELFGAKADGTTDDSTSIQQCINFCLLVNAKMKLFAKKYYIASAVKVSNDNVSAWSIFEIEGELSGSAVSLTQSSDPGTVILTNGNSAFEFEFYNYFNESVKLRNISFSNEGSKGTSVAIHYKFNSSSYRRKQYIYDCNATGFDSAVKFEGLSSTFNDNYIGTTVIDFFHSYSCNRDLYINNAFINLFQCKNSLFHGAAIGSIIFDGTDGGGFPSFSSTHIEGATEGFITGTRLINIILNDFSSENTGVSSGNGLFNLEAVSSNATITINGYYSTNLMPNFNLPANCKLKASCPNISIRSKGGFVYTPDNVSIESEDDDYSFVIFPLDRNRKGAYRSANLNKFAGTTTGITPYYDSDIPESLLPEYSFVESSTLYDHRSSFGVDVSNDRYIIASFIVQTTGTLFGFDSGSQFINGGVTTNIESSYVQSIDSPVVVLLMIPVLANIDFERLSLVFRNVKWATSAYVSFESSGRVMTLTSLGHPQNKEHQTYVTISPSNSYTFSETFIYAQSYAITAQLLLDGGLNGFIDYKFYGKTTNGSKYVDAVGASKYGSIVVATADGSHVEPYNITVTNNSAGDITASLKVKYIS